VFSSKDGISNAFVTLKVRKHSLCEQSHWRMYQQNKNSSNPSNVQTSSNSHCIYVSAS